MIINPIIIYLIGIVDGFKSFLFFLAFVIIVAMLFCIFLEAESDEDVEKLKRYLKKCFVWLIITIAINTIVPNKNTMIAMISTKYITVDNIKLGKDVVIDTIKEIVEVINKEEK